MSRLRGAIDKQVRAIDRCMKLHAVLCPQEMQPFHETLERFFQKNFSGLSLRLIRRFAMLTVLQQRNGLVFRQRPFRLSE